MNKEIIYRIIALPFMAIIVALKVLDIYYKWMKQYILYGCEVIPYDKDENILIQDIYNELKNQRNDTNRQED